MPESRYHWSGEEVNAIVSIWSDEAIQRALRSSDSEYRGAAKVYHEIFVRLRKLGYKGTVQQCRDKLKKLKGQYKEIKANSSDRWSYFPPSWFDAMDAVLGQRHRKPVLRSGKATGSQKNGPSLTLSSLRLLAPPLRLMSAFMWQVAQQHIVKHYGKLEEFVTLVTEMVPELLSSRQRTQLLLGLRARLVLELCRNESTADLVTIQPHLDKIHYLTEYAVHKESNDDELEATESNFVELVQTLLEDPSEREHFFQEVLPVHYGPRYDTALQVLVWEFLSRLEELLPVPDFTQTAAWLGAAASVLEECGNTIFDAEELKTLLQHHQHQGNLKKSKSPTRMMYLLLSMLNCLSGYFSYYTADTILSTLSLPPTIRVVISSEQVVSDKTRSCSDGDECFKNGTERVGDGEEREGPSNGGREEEEEDRQTEENWENKDYNERNEEKMYLEQQEQINVLPAETSDPCIPVPSNGLNSDMSSQVLACSLCPFSHSDMAKLHQHIRIRHRGEDRKLLRSKESGTDNSHPTRSTKLLHQHIRTKHQGDERKRQHSEESGTENLPSSTNKIPYRPNNMTLSCPHCGNIQDAQKIQETIHWSNVEIADLQIRAKEEICAQMSGTRRDSKVYRLNGELPPGTDDPIPSHSTIIRQHIRTTHQGEEWKCLRSEKSGTDHPLPTRSPKRIPWASKIKAYKCTHCGKVFTFPFHCNQCDKRYASKNKSPSSWMPDEAHGFFSQRSGTSGSEGINSASRLKKQKIMINLHPAGRLRRSVQEHLLSGLRNKRVFTKLSSELAALGFNRCREKIIKLKQEYHKIKDDNKKRSYNRCRERWFAIMDSVLRHQPSTLVIDSDGKIWESTQPDSPQEVEDSDGSVQEQLLSAVRNKRVFTKLSSGLAALGSTKTSKQCREKIKKLKQEYKKNQDLH
ncbi:unnamed protein product [Coregonus sp. 'balchen']|nr:unnamed protein product [Coregonus sp. 'balchen']